MDKQIFLSNIMDYSIYETPKHFVKNEVLYDKKLGRHKVIHTYRKKNKTLESRINKHFNKTPIIINRNTYKGKIKTRFWQ